MRSSFILFILAVGILLGGGYVWLVEPSEQATSWPEPSKDTIQSQAAGIAHEGSARPGALNEIATPPPTNEEEGKSLRTITADSPVRQLGSDVSGIHAEEMPSDLGARSDHQTIGLGHQENEKSRSAASTGPSDDDALSHPQLGSRITNEPWAAGENGHGLRKLRRGSQERRHTGRHIHRQHIARQRFSELIEHPLELRCMACVMFDR
jgi:hypothetical protein